MINPQEIFILTVAGSVLLLIVILYRRLLLITGWKFLLAAFSLYFASTILTVLEGFILPDLLNILEHLCRTLFPVPLILWVRATAREKRLAHRAP